MLGFISADEQISVEVFKPAMKFSCLAQLRHPTTTSCCVWADPTAFTRKRKCVALARARSLKLDIARPSVSKPPYLSVVVHHELSHALCIVTAGINEIDTGNYSIMHNLLLCVSFLAFFWPLASHSLSSAGAKASACQQLEHLYTNETLLPGDKGYVEGYSENWSETCVRKPFCIFEPLTAEEVSDAIRILVRSKTSFAIRSGGHMQVPGSSAITKGVLISTRRLDQKQFINKERTVASIGPGNRWVDVYRWLAPFKLAAIGGRYQPVGVAGLLLGGGISYFASQHGWAANNVINYQVVLANSSIVNANATHNRGLWWALKGGSSNFGIVTRYDVRLHPLPAVYGGTTSYKPQYLDQFVNAIGAYAAPGGGSSDVLTSANPSVIWNFTTGGYQLISITTRNSSDGNLAAFTNFTAIPRVSSDVKLHSDLLDLTADTASTGVRTQRDLYFSKGIKATPEAVSLANKTYFDAIANSPAIRAAKGMLVAATYQTVTKAWLKKSVALGGDAIDLDPARGPFVLFLGVLIWEDPADDGLAYDFAHNFTALLAKRVKANGFDHPFIYMNDAMLHQDVYRHYGAGKSLSRLRQVAKRYDPTGVFQRLVPGGFKLGDMRYGSAEERS